MKDDIQNNSDEIAIIFYDAPLPPKYFRLTKKFIKTVFVVFPLIVVGFISVFFFWGMGSRLKSSPSPSIPSIMTTPDTQISDLKNEIKALEQSNKDLSNRLSTTPSAPSGQATEDPYLMLVKKPYGMQNLIGENQVTLDQFKFLKESNKVTLNFQIISSNPEKKVMGHVLVFMLSESGVMAYPKEANSNILTGVKYSTGEPFSVSRLRPTAAEFNHQLQGESVKFAIYIFTREGDLLLIRETESFQTGPKT